MSEKIITSLTNPIVKKWVALRTKAKYRIQERSALVPGSQVISELMNFTMPRLIMVGAHAPLPPPQVPWMRVSSEVMKKVANLPMLPDWMAEFPLPAEASFQGCTRLLILDHIKDPGNLGTLFRTALAFGWGHIFLMEGSADPFGEKALQASKGACFRVPLKIGTLLELKHIIARENLDVRIADLTGHNPESLPHNHPIALVLGSEVSGVSQDLKSLGPNVCLAMTAQTESLNVAIAGAILMYLWRS